jgi:hypothetical protein
MWTGVMLRDGKLNSIFVGNGSYKRMGLLYNRISRVSVERVLSSPLLSQQGRQDCHSLRVSTRCNKKAISFQTLALNGQF